MGKRSKFLRCIINRGAFCWIICCVGGGHDLTCLGTTKREARFEAIHIKSSVHPYLSVRALSLITHDDDTSPCFLPLPAYRAPLSRTPPRGIFDSCLPAPLADAHSSQKVILISPIASSFRCIVLVRPTLIVCMVFWGVFILHLLFDSLRWMDAP